jgi:hypothetical protein
VNILAAHHMTGTWLILQIISLVTAGDMCCIITHSTDSDGDVFH